jgi:hypothetical protein
MIDEGLPDSFSEFLNATTAALSGPGRHSAKGFSVFLQSHYAAIICLDRLDIVKEPALSGELYSPQSYRRAQVMEVALCDSVEKPITIVNNHSPSSKNCSFRSPLARKTVLEALISLAGPHSIIGGDLNMSNSALLRCVSCLASFILRASVATMLPQCWEIESELLTRYSFPSFSCQRARQRPRRPGRRSQSLSLCLTCPMLRVAACCPFLSCFWSLLLLNGLCPASFCTSL